MYQNDMVAAVSKISIKLKAQIQSKFKPFNYAPLSKKQSILSINHQPRTFRATDLFKLHLVERTDMF